MDKKSAGLNDAFKGKLAPKNFIKNPNWGRRSVVLRPTLSAEWALRFGGASRLGSPTPTKGMSTIKKSKKLIFVLQVGPRSQPSSDETQK